MSIPVPDTLGTGLGIVGAQMLATQLSSWGFSLVALLDPSQAHTGFPDPGPDSACPSFKFLLTLPLPEVSYDSFKHSLWKEI